MVCATGLPLVDLCDPQIVHAGKGKGRMMSVGASDNAMATKRDRMALSPDESPTNERAAVKKRKTHLSLPPVTASSSKLEHPELSRPPTVVSSYPDDPFTPQPINPWEPGYSIPSIDFLV
ncbi:hypothetical protein M405DRAFT_846579 [Rhizopogon salebrosus TDB-379]|nr:hypothetical protein M405DRAFT_846579 [Rhizopogon salebrosus TDB-379]